MKEFLSICEYLEVTPQQFFDTDSKQPALIQKAVNGMSNLSEEDMLMLLGIINRLQK